MIHFGTILEILSLPALSNTEPKTAVLEVPLKSPAVKTAVARFEEALSGMKHRTIWGEVSGFPAKEFVRGFREFLDGDFAGAEVCFSKALSQPEFGWFEREMFLGRAFVRYMQYKFEAGLADTEHALNRFPEDSVAWTLAGMLHYGLGMAKAWKGDNPGEFFERAFSCFGESLRGGPKEANLRDHPVFRFLERETGRKGK
jgi:hypothetical protein